MVEIMASLHDDQEMLNTMRDSLMSAGHGEQCVLFKDGKVLGFFPDESSAFSAGVEKFGVSTDFVVDRVSHQPAPCVSLTWELGLMRVSG